MRLTAARLTSGCYAALLLFMRRRSTSKERLGRASAGQPCLSEGSLDITNSWCGRGGVEPKDRPNRLVRCEMLDQEGMASGLDRASAPGLANQYRLGAPSLWRTHL